MSVIYLRHPRHGSKVAVSEQEANADAAHGWERYNPGHPLDHDRDGTPGGSLPGEQATAKKRGRPRKQQ